MCMITMDFLGNEILKHGLQYKTCLLFSSTAAIMASLLAGVRTIYGRSAFTCAVRGTLPILRTLCSNRRNTIDA
jgi:hypothetical protein